MPLIRNLIQVNWNFSAVEHQNYYLFGVALISFFIAFQIVERMKISKKTESYYLSILGVYFLITVMFILLVAVIAAIVSYL